MLAVLAWLGTYIFWALSAKESPTPPMALETEPRRAAQAIAARHLFGEVVTGPVTVTPIDIRLTGVIAAVRQGEVGMAFLALEGKPAVSVREGGEVVPGIILHRVLPRQVELARGPQIQVLTLPDANKSSPQQAGGAPQASPAPQISSNPPPRAVNPEPQAPSTRRRGRRGSSSAEDES